MELKGSLKNFPLPDIIQLIGMGRRTGVLLVTLGGNEESSIFFDSGDMTHAEYGNLEGPSVIYKLFKKQDGHFQFTSGVGSPKISIQSDWMSIVMEAARRFDEERREGGIADEVLEEALQEPRERAEELGADPGRTRQEMVTLLNKRFGKKAKKILDELQRLDPEPGRLLEFCDKAEKFVFVFIDRGKAREVADELRAIIRRGLLS